MKNIEEEIQKTLHSLDGLERAKANPFLYAKIRHRLAEAQTPLGIRLPVSLQLGMLTLVLVLNFWTIASNWQKSQSSANNATTFAESMGLTLTDNSFYP